jgi:hypothetical protein
MAAFGGEGGIADTLSGVGGELGSLIGKGKGSGGGELMA